MLEHGATPLDENRRRAFRVETRLPVRHRRLTPEERSLKERELEVSASAPVPRDPALAAWLGRVEAKLDRLSAALGIPSDAPPGPEEARDVDLSSVGMRFACGETLAAGDPVWVECTVPGRAPRYVRALARVARSGPSAEGAGGWVALDFERIRDRDRDALVRFTQDVQRCAKT